MYDEETETEICDTCEELKDEVMRWNRTLHSMESISYKRFFRGLDRELNPKIEKVRQRRDGYVQAQIEHQRESHS